MEDNTTYSKMGLFHIERKSIGFLGRYLIEGEYVKYLEKDFWAEGTSYNIYPLGSDQKQFEDFCFSKLAATAPADIFRRLSPTVKTFYVPMVLAGDQLICLYNNDETLTYSFLNKGSISASTVAEGFGEATTFDPKPQEPGYAKIEFLSMKLTLKGASYVAKVNDVQFDFFNHPDHTVYLVPVHSMSFRYNNEEYTIMSLADVNFTGFASNIPLPEDPFLTQKETKYKLPWISTIFMILVALGIVALTIFLVVFILKSTKIDIYLKVVLLALPIYGIYVVSWMLMGILAGMFNAVLMPVDRFLAGIAQKNAVQKNFEQKRSDLNRSYAGKRVVFPEVSSVAKINKEAFSRNFENFMEFVKSSKISRK